MDPQDQYLNIKLTSQPVNGGANKQLGKLLSKTFSVSSSYITIEKGENNRYKTCRIQRPKLLPDFVAQ